MQTVLQFWNPHTLLFLLQDTYRCVRASSDPTDTHAITGHMHVSAQREGQGCQIAGLGVSFLH